MNPKPPTPHCALGITLSCFAVAAAAWAASPPTSDGSPAPTNSLTVVRSYPVNRKVTDFANQEDLSTPEAAYAAWNRASASGDTAAWRHLSVRRFARRMPQEGTRTQVSTNVAQTWLSAELLQVWVFQERLAMVSARLPHPTKSLIDLRIFDLEDGSWKNAGNEMVGSLEQARALFTKRCAWREAEWKTREAPPVADPERHLQPFVEFLRSEGADPREAVLRALNDHRVVVLGEVHNRPRQWALNAAIARSTEFARRAGVVFLEFPCNDQPLIDRFLAAPTYDPGPVIEMLRDMFEMGWPDQPTVDFCQAVWEINQNLPPQQQIRIVLVDMARPWKEIRKREDWLKHNVDRDAFMADNIVNHLQQRADDPRHALFLVGWMHALKNLKLPDGEPFRAAGWHLRQRLGSSNVFTVFPHCPVLANRGDVGGRIALGLFESAFAVLTNRPMLFPLSRGPFGEQRFDASLDLVTTDTFAAAFDAYLYLGPLEDEIMSPLVTGFYTEEFAREVDRRLRIMEGTSLPQTDARSLEALRAQWWGKPRREWQNLGPLDAWRRGSSGEPP